MENILKIVVENYKNKCNVANATPSREWIGLSFENSLKTRIASDEIVHLSDTSRKITEEAGGLMQKIIPDIDKTSKLVQEISAANMEQSSGVNQVNHTLQQLNSITQQNASSSEKLASSAEELAAKAVELQDLISFFKINSTSTNVNLNGLYNRKSVTKTQKNNFFSTKKSRA